MSSSAELVGYVYLVVNLYGVVVYTIVGHGYNLWFAFGYGSDNQISFIHGSGAIFISIFLFFTSTI